MYQLIIGNTIIPYEERRSSRAKRIVLTITPECLRISAPRRVTKKEIQAFIDEKKDWILEHWQRLQGEASPNRITEFADGTTVPLLGKPLTIKLRTDAPKTIRLELRDNELQITMPEALSQERWHDHIREILLKWYKLKARAVFTKKLDTYAKQMGLTYNRLRIKEQKTRWGSCSSQGNINLNWRAVMAPDEVIDYLVVHELAHLKHLNHSAEFWNLVAVYVPEYKKWRKWLREHGKELRRV